MMEGKLKFGGGGSANKVSWVGDGEERGKKKGDAVGDSEGREGGK